MRVIVKYRKGTKQFKMTVKGVRTQKLINYIKSNDRLTLISATVERR